MRIIVYDILNILLWSVLGFITYWKFTTNGKRKHIDMMLILICGPAIWVTSLIALFNVIRLNLKKPSKDPEQF